MTNPVLSDPPLDDLDGEPVTPRDYGLLGPAWEQVEEAVSVLKRTDRGRAAMRALLKLLDDGGVSLDHPGQEAVYTLLEGVWGPWTGTARDLMREALSRKSAGS